LNRRLVILNVALLGLAGLLVWTLRAHWSGAQAQQRAVLQRKTEPRKILAPPSPPPVKPVSPGEYLDVASRMLFSKDRNPTVVIEAPPPKPEPPMPALPAYHGQMAIGEPVAFLSLASTAQRGYRAGESIGDFKLVSFDRESIRFDWNGKTVERKLDELRPKETAQASPPPAPAAAPSAVKPVTSLGLASGSSTTNAQPTSDDPMMGPVLSDGTRGCVPSDTSPGGTVHAGYRKDMTMTIVGALCHWELLK